ncbi:MAG TPA: 6-pyruvoyl-tetrahydropterin synthase-related protein [Patescibacteria group bacterium]|nr:6-pyruvoyl-tetrahydropterin synthase-related protein [Patescibacteria group bacterium]
MKNILHRSVFWFLIVLVFSLIAIIPLTKSGFYPHHDDIHIIRLYEMHQCFVDLQLPCRWVPDLGGLYGYPLFLFYGPFPYYVGEFLYLLSGSLLLSVKLLFAISFYGSIIGMFLFAKSYFGPKGAAIASFLYAFLPYRAVDLYVRGAMAELFALMCIPFILFAMKKTVETPKARYKVLLAISLFGLLTSHNLSTVMFAPLLVAYAIFLLARAKRWRSVLRIGTGVVVGFLLSSFYTIPQILEKGLVHVETTTMGYFGYTEHFKGIKKLFFDRSFGYGASVREYPGGPTDDMTFQIGIIHWIGACIAGVVALWLWKKGKRKLAVLLFLFEAVFLLSVFLIHPRSIFVWQALPFLAYLQFPWRFLLVVGFVTSFLGGGITLLFPSRRAQILMVVGVYLLCGVFYSSYFQPKEYLQVNDAYYFSPQEWDRQIKRSIFDFLPKSAEAPPAELATVPYEVLDGDVTVRDFSKNSQTISFTTEGTGTVRVSQYYYPGWMASLDGKTEGIAYNNPLGLMTLSVPEGIHKVNFSFEKTEERSISDALTLVGIMAVIFILGGRKVFHGKSH